MAGTALPTTDSSAFAVDQGLQDVLNDLIPVAETAIIAAQPWAGTPVLREAWEEAFQFFAQEISDAAGKLGGFVVIDIQKYAALANASKALATLQAAQKGGDPDAISQANAAADSAAAGILHFIGTISPPG